MERIAANRISLPVERCSSTRIDLPSCLEVREADTHNAKSGIFSVFTQRLERFRVMVFPIDRCLVVVRLPTAGNAILPCAPVRLECLPQYPDSGTVLISLKVVLVSQASKTSCR